MKKFVFGFVAAIGLAVASVATAAPITLTPANPQPSGLKRGLSVAYGTAADGVHIKSLSDARLALRGAKRGKALRGLDYRDTSKGQPTLTSQKSENVAAAIKGYVKFDKPGVYTIDFFTNDGLSAQIGGKTVGHFDGRQTCDTTIATDVKVPSAGWYEFKATYFNRLNTSCLMMRWAPQGQAMKWTPNSAFGYK
jgi:hypothetical protein